MLRILSMYCAFECDIHICLNMNECKLKIVCIVAAHISDINMGHWIYLMLNIQTMNSKRIFVLRREHFHCYFQIALHHIRVYTYNKWISDFQRFIQMDFSLCFTFFPAHSDEKVTHINCWDAMFSSGENHILERCLKYGILHFRITVWNIFFDALWTVCLYLSDDVNGRKS